MRLQDFIMPATSLALSWGTVGLAMAAAPVERITLDNGRLEVVVTPQLGGRGLVLRRVGEPNLLKVGEAVREQPMPAVDAQAGDIPYLGHDVWVGPQSRWWLDQQANPARRQARANWPPDPYLGFATVRVLERSADALRLEGVDSPVSGVRLGKRFAFAADDPDTVEVQASARNIRDQPVAWDLWFNTRLAASTRVFVPVAANADLRLQAAGDVGTVPPQHRLQEGMLVVAAADSVQAQRGKFLVQPSAGWMAGFQGRQVLLLRFELQPRALIHPEHGQVELYLDAPAAAAASGLLEMEVHAPYRRLQPGQAMQAAERWTVLRYDGADEAGAQRRFLCAQATRLGLAGACPPDR